MTKLTIIYYKTSSTRTAQTCKMYTSCNILLHNSSHVYIMNIKGKTEVACDATLVHVHVQ